MTGSGVFAGPCADGDLIGRLLTLRADDTLDAAGRQTLDAHLAACDDCRAAAWEADPTLLFAPLAVSADALRARRASRWDEAAEAAEADRLAEDVLAAIRARQTESAATSRAPGRRVALRAAAVLLAVAGIAGLVVLKRSDDSVANDVAARAWAELPLPLAIAEGPARPLIEELRTPGARVYQFAGGSPKEATVVFVANPDADL